MKTRTYDFFSDPCHGWIKVTRKQLFDLHIAYKITRCSYQRNDHVYLEEDCDATTFSNAMENLGFLLRFRSHIADKQSKIRNYEPYSYEPLRNI
jgi:hypothetical protein